MYLRQGVSIMKGISIALQYKISQTPYSAGHNSFQKHKKTRKKKEHKIIRQTAAYVIRDRLEDRARDAQEADHLVLLESHGADHSRVTVL